MQNFILCDNQGRPIGSGSTVISSVDFISMSLSSASLNLVKYDEDLNPVLEKASDSELEPLVGYLKTKFSETLTTEENYERFYPQHSRYTGLIAQEIRKMGGNSFMNAFRKSEGPSYHEIACDVASKLRVSYDNTSPVEVIESAILEDILKKALEKMTDEEKSELLEEIGGTSLKVGGLTTGTLITAFRLGGFESYKLTVVIANQIAKLVLGRGLMFATNTALIKTASVITGPVGMVLTGIWAAVDIAGPAYKVTVSSVIHVAMLRKKSTYKAIASSTTV